MGEFLPGLIVLALLILIAAMTKRKPLPPNNSSSHRDVFESDRKY